jgi:hypothetical protein
MGTEAASNGRVAVGGVQVPGKTLQKAGAKPLARTRRRRLDEVSSVASFRCIKSLPRVEFATLPTQRVSLVNLPVDRQHLDERGS